MPQYRLKISIAGRDMVGATLGGVVRPKLRSVGDHRDKVVDGVSPCRRISGAPK